MKKLNDVDAGKLWKDMFSRKITSEDTKERSSRHMEYESYGSVSKNCLKCFYWVGHCHNCDHPIQGDHNCGDFIEIDIEK